MQMCSNPSIINSMQHLQSPAMNPIPPCTYVKVLYGQAIPRPPHHQNQICQPKHKQDTDCTWAGTIGEEAAEVRPAEEMRRTAGTSISHPKSRYSRHGA